MHSIRGVGEPPGVLGPARGDGTMVRTPGVGGVVGEGVGVGVVDFAGCEQSGWVGLIKHRLCGVVGVLGARGPMLSGNRSPGVRDEVSGDGTC